MSIADAKPAPDLESPEAPTQRPGGGRTRSRANWTARLHSLGLGLLGLAMIVGLWHVVAVSDLFGEGQVPTPLIVWDSLVALFRDGEGVAAMTASVRRVVLGLAIGVTAATPVGFLLGWYPRLRSVVEPLMNFFRALPPIALIPLVIVYLGIGESARVSVLVWATFFVSVVILFEGIRSLDPIFVKAARVLGATNNEIFLKVVLPLSVPHLLTAIRVALGVAWGTLVAAELIAAQVGLGAVISTAANYFDIPRVYAGILLIGLSALLMDRLVGLVIRRLIRWQDVI